MSKVTARKPGLLTSGEIEAVRLVGPSAPATKRRLPSMRCGLERGAAGEAGGVAVEFVDHRLHAVVGLGDRRRGEGVGLQDVGAGERVGEVDVLDRLRLGQRQQIVVALEGAFAADEALAAELGFVEAEVLDLRPHRAVEDQHALARRRRQRRADVALSRRGGEQLQWAGGHSRGRLLDITT